MARAQTVTLLRWAPAATWMALIFWLSSRPALPEPPIFSYSLAAIAGHVVLYFVLTIFILIGFGAGRVPARRGDLMLAGALALLYGATDEFHQLFVDGRNGSIFDVGVDGVGILLALWTWTMLWRRFATS